MSHWLERESEEQETEATDFTDFTERKITERSHALGAPVQGSKFKVQSYESVFNSLPSVAARSSGVCEICAICGRPHPAPLPSDGRGRRIWESAIPGRRYAVPWAIIGAALQAYCLRNVPICGGSNFVPFVSFCSSQAPSEVRRQR